MARYNVPLAAVGVVLGGSGVACGVGAYIMESGVAVGVIAIVLQLVLFIVMIMRDE